MRQQQGLDTLIEDYPGNLTSPALAKLLLDDLKNCLCSIFGEKENEERVLLAELTIIPESLFYEEFDKRIEFTVDGEILNSQYVPLTYIVQGYKFSFYGRCSTIRKVCGVDLYLNASYTGNVGDRVRQKFSVSVKQLFKTIEV